MSNRHYKIEHGYKFVYKESREEKERERERERERELGPQSFYLLKGN